MKKVLASALLALSFTASAQSVITVVPTALSLTRWIVDITDKDRLEETEPVVVKSSGTGSTCDEALLNAKRYALEKVSGSWVYSIRRSSHDTYDEKIVEYSGGVIKSYKYLRNDCTFVIIEAQVVPRAHKIESNTADVRGMIVHLDSRMENESRLKKSVNLIDDKNVLHFL